MNTSQTLISTSGSRATALGSAVALKYATNDQVSVEKIEDRLKSWHEQLGIDSKPQIRPLTRYVRRWMLFSISRFNI
jgi:hypothetical protein